MNRDHRRKESRRKEQRQSNNPNKNKRQQWRETENDSGANYNGRREVLSATEEGETQPQPSHEIQ